MMLDGRRERWTVLPEADSSIAGAVVAGHARAGAVRDLPSPITGQECARVGWADIDVVAEAVDAASAVRRRWAATTMRQRAAALRAIAAALRSRAAELADVITLETGKRRSEAAGEVEFSAKYFDWYADATVLNRDGHLQSKDRRFLTRREPVGVVAAVTPWNFPLSIPARKAAPAIAAGCPVVVKVSELAPLSGLAMAKIASRHVPAGVLSAVTGDGEKLTTFLVDHDDVAAVTFTGSTAVGVEVASRAMRSMTRVTMELGGNAPFVVCSDADMQVAIEALLVAKFRNNGASCIAANNVFVHRSRHDELLSELVTRIPAMSVGDPFDPDVDLGPQIRPQHVRQLQGRIRTARDRGHEVWTGEAPATGWFCEPALVAVGHDAPVERDEVFGPICIVRPFDEEDEVVEVVNSLRTGLGGYVCSRNVGRAVDLATQLRIGIVGVNNGAPNTPEVPFGGFCLAGVGREGGLTGLNEFTEEQAISVARPHEACDGSSRGDR